MMRQDFHVFQGMRQDNHPIRQESKYLWEAHNIRFTARDDSTLLSMTNEKGTKIITKLIVGSYIGHCVVGNYLVVFTVGNKNSTLNYIYRIEKKADGWVITILYIGNLNMDVEHPIQALGIYEGELVQKVYWVDGKNQPRSINIVANRLLFKDKDIMELSDADKNNLYPEGCFDFTQELLLNEEITVTREEGGGAFSPGTIQYAFSYYNRHGQESNLFYTTELLNISFPTRGGSPEDVVSNTFHISIKNPESNFQYLRIYSIHRTSVDATPIVKIVTDIEITGSNEITYVDTGLTGSNIDPTKMLYIGGESIIAGTIAEKDNTLFLGNIELKRDSIPDSIKNTLKDSVANNKVSIGTRTIELNSVDDSEAIYEYSNQLAAGNTSSFKVGDTYRLGIQFQHKTGKWSEPLWLGNYDVPRDIKPHRDGDNIVVPKMTFSLDNDTKSTLSSLEYKRARALVVLPSIYDRMVLAQGILCPTVFSIKDRVSNTPFAQSSWFFRPMSESTNNLTDIEKGSTVSFAHLDLLKSGSDRGAEIQNMISTPFSTANSDAKQDRATNNNAFFVDQSIITMHSPDIEFDDSTKQALEEGDFELNIVGLTEFKSNAGDISIQTSSAVPAPNDNGFFHKSFLTTNYENKGMVAGMFYKSHLIDDKDSGKTLYAYNATQKSWELNWLVYPWQRSGSLNNDIVRPESGGARTSVLKRKVISNIRFSPDVKWLSKSWSSGDKNGITPVSIFNSNEVSLIKIPTPKNSGIRALNYYGNVDTLITTDSEYTFYVTPNTGVDLQGSGVIVNPFTKIPLQSIKTNYSDNLAGDFKEQLKTTNEPVRMKYKSTPHAVFAFNYLNNSSPVILPRMNNLNKYIGTNEVPFWSNVDPEIPNQYRDVDIQEVYPISGSPKEVENAVIKNLESNYGDTLPDDCAICTCSVRSQDTNYADLYVAVQGGKWKKVTEDSPDLKLGNIYYYKGGNIYWKVVYHGSGRVLYKIGETTSYSVKQDNIDISETKPCLYMAELRRKSKPTNMFGGDTDEALRNNSWIPAGPIVPLDSKIEFRYGDTYYQRYDCLKTYSFTEEDENSVIEIASFMCESRINLDGRYDRNRGQISNLNMSPINFNLMNPIYSQRDNFFNYRILDKEYYRNNKYPTQILWSLEKSYLEDIDTWANVTLANSIDLSGSAGSITSLETFNDTLIAFQEQSISQILFNSRVQIPTSDGTPIEITNNYKVEGTRPISNVIGCQDKFSIAKSPSGLYFIDNNADILYLYNGQLQDISTQFGGKFWLRKYHANEKWNINSKSSVRLSYDPKNKDLYLSPIGDTNNENTLCYSEQMGQFTSLMSYSKAIMFPIDNSFYSITSSNGTTKLWENFKGNYNQFFDEIKLPRFTYICNEDVSYTKIFDTIEYRADVYNKEGLLIHNKSFDWIKAANEYQDTGEKTLSQARRTINDISLRKKFRVWRGQIPRQGRERIRNPWTSISLGFKKSLNENDNMFHFILHDISTKYTI
jgi:hypothetical protein|nr:MAG TPA: stabilization protein [Crassvirales sp.]